MKKTNLDLDTMHQTKDVLKSIGSDRWAMSIGLVPDSIQQNLMGFAYISHPDVRDVEIVVDTDNKEILFKIFLPAFQISKRKTLQKRYHYWRGSTSLLGKMIELHFSKKWTPVNIEGTLKKFVRDYLGVEVKVEVEVLQWVP